jgi:chromosome segregation ATPase
MINTTFLEMIPKSEYDKLLHENIRLKQRESELTGQLIDLQLKVNIQNITIQDLTQQNELLREKIKDLEASVLELKTENKQLKTEIVELKTEIVGLKTEIIELKNENKQLKTEIVDLKTEIVELKTEIVELKTEIVELKTENKQLKTEIVELKTENKQLKTNKIISKLMVVIQDLNAIDSLETKATSYTKKLTRFRKKRNGEFHFIMKNGNKDDDDSELEIQEKKYIIKLFLNKLNEETISLFERNNNVVGLVSYLKTHLKNARDVVLDSDKEEDLDIKNDMIQFFGNLTIDDLEQKS